MVFLKILTKTLVPVSHFLERDLKAYNFCKTGTLAQIFKNAILIEQLLSTAS